MVTTLKTTMTKIEANNTTIKALKVENGELIRVVIKAVIEDINTTKNDKVLNKDGLLSKVQILNILKIRNDIKGDILFGAVCDYIELNLTIDYQVCSKALFIDLIRLTKKGLISKSALKGASLEKLKELRKTALNSLA